MAGLPPQFIEKFKRAAEAGKVLREVSGLLFPHIDRIMRGVYMSAGFKDPDLLNRLMATQQPHYRKLLTAEFDEEYVRIIRELQAIHIGMGLNMDNYFVGFSHILNQFVAELVKGLRKQPDRLGAALAALNVAVFTELDLALTLHVYNIEQKARAGRLAIADDLDNSVHKVVAELSNSATKLQQNAQAMTTAAASTNREAQTVGESAERAAGNVETAAAAAEELSASIMEINRQVTQSGAIARRAAEQARRTDETIASLSEAADRIGVVVNLINDIAGQTNLLALNATIEAARAGAAGKGFAVVANEVKSLANQTAKATGEITAQVQSIQKVTAVTVAAIGEIGRTIEEINVISADIANAVEQQGTATDEIARNVAEASGSTAAVSSSVARVTDMADKSGTVAGDVLTASKVVSTQAEELGTVLTRFLAGIRAA